MTKDEEELKVIYSALDDCRRLIAAGKVQRWDVVKWGVTVNVALATAAAFKGSFNFVLLGVAVAIISGWLVLYYNRRITGARNDASHLVDQIQTRGIDYNSIVGKTSDYQKGPKYDFRELIIFMLILIISAALPLLPAWMISTVKPVP